LFYEESNSDGTLDLLCLQCRTLVGENLSPRELSDLREAHRCRGGAKGFTVKGRKKLSFMVLERLQSLAFREKWEWIGLFSKLIEVDSRQEAYGGENFKP
jgi:hypothetical protein